jgi:hypothetical protein
MVDHVLGSDLKVGDKISVQWGDSKQIGPGVDVITALRVYKGPLKSLFTEGAQMATFAAFKTGMTIDNSGYYFRWGNIYADAKAA